MNIKAKYCSYLLQFKQPSGTSRGVLKTKKSYFIRLEMGRDIGYGECGILEGLSHDDVPQYEDQLDWACKNISLGLGLLWEQLKEFPSIQFGLEQAFKSLKAEYPFELFGSKFTQGQASIPINGLVWMGNKAFMKAQIVKVLNQGFSCVKMKIGAIDIVQELELLTQIRKTFSALDLEIRVDANGAFNLPTARKVMRTLSQLRIHSIEQPIGVGHKEDLATLCQAPEIPVALDESLIGCTSIKEKAALLDTIAPQYIILKPSFIGGFKGSDQWINLANQRKIGWWVTSALESNIGLNAIAQWVYTKGQSQYQGLGTGSLYTNNIESPLFVKNGAIAYHNNGRWNPSLIDKLCT